MMDEEPVRQSALGRGGVLVELILRPPSGIVALCAKETAGVDVERTLRIAKVNVAVVGNLSLDVRCDKKSPSSVSTRLGTSYSFPSYSIAPALSTATGNNSRCVDRHGPLATFERSNQACAACRRRPSKRVRFSVFYAPKHSYNSSVRLPRVDSLPPRAPSPSRCRRHSALCRPTARQRRRPPVADFRR